MTKLWLRIIDAYGFTIAVIVQIGMVTASMLSLAPDIVTAVGYIGIGVAAVLFAPRAFQKYLETKRIRYFINYCLFASITVFIGISFSLAGTSAQAVTSNVIITLENDSFIKQYADDLASARTAQAQVQAQYDDTLGPADLLERLQQRLSDYDAEIMRLQKHIEERRNEIKTGEATRQARTLVSDKSSDSVFSAILLAVQERRIVALIFWGVLMLGTELMIINSLSEEKNNVVHDKEVPSEPEAEEKKDSVVTQEHNRNPFEPFTKNEIILFLKTYWPVDLSSGKWPSSAYLEAQGISKHRQADMWRVLRKAGIIDGTKAVQARQKAVDIINGMA